MLGVLTEEPLLRATTSAIFSTTFSVGMWCRHGHVVRSTVSSLTRSCTAVAGASHNLREYGDFLAVALAGEYMSVSPSNSIKVFLGITSSLQSLCQREETTKRLDRSDALM